MLWQSIEGMSETDRRDLNALSEIEIEERFFSELEFGTAGMRGVLGLGANRMNVYNIRRATQGLADYLVKRQNCERGVVIAYDSRHNSETFAWETAQVLLANGVRTYLFSTLHSVPQLSFAIRHYNAAAGVIITASHNPSKYNGYKVYGETGGQIGPAAASDLTEHIRRYADYTGIKRLEPGEARRHPLLTMIGEDVDGAYFAALLTLRLDKSAERRMPIVYTPLNGAGNLPVRRILRETGFENVFVVAEQELPDPDFSTVKAPNPEERDCYILAQRLADEKGANLILATDPDADRLGVAVRDGQSEFKILTGNQLGCLLLYYILMRRKALSTLPNDAVCVKSIVSSSLADAIAADFGVQMMGVLTGFRYIGEKIDESRKQNREFIFGFEESYGYLVGTFGRDKDAVGAAMMVAEAAAYYCAESRTLLDMLELIHQKYGYYAEHVVNMVREGKEGIEKIRLAMKALRSEIPAKIGGEKVASVCDYQARKCTQLETGLQTVLSLPASDVLMFHIEDSAWVCVRPSGTEPKLKLYGNARGNDALHAQKRVEAIVNDMNARLAAWM